MLINHGAAHILVIVSNQMHLYTQPVCSLKVKILQGRAVRCPSSHVPNAHHGHTGLVCSLVAAVVNCLCHNATFETTFSERNSCSCIHTLRIFNFFSFSLFFSPSFLVYDVPQNNIQQTTEIKISLFILSTVEHTALDYKL